jgi:hypothetical protein
MNGDNQPQQEQHHLAERVARVETALDYQGKAMAELRDEVRAGFAQMDRRFTQLESQILKARTSDFRILLSICLTTALSVIGLLIKAIGPL